MAEASTVKIRRNKKGTTIEFININLKPEELHQMIENARKEATGK